MFIEFPKDAPLKVDGKEFADHIRLNIAKDHKLRAKMDYIIPGKTERIPVDLVVYEWSTPKLERFSLSIMIDGKEMTRGLPFNLKLSFDFFRKVWRITGDFSGTNVDKQLQNIAEIFGTMKELVLAHVNPSK